jgi:hypothetical protein
VRCSHLLSGSARPWITWLGPRARRYGRGARGGGGRRRGRFSSAASARASAGPASPVPLDHHSSATAMALPRCQHRVGTGRLAVGNPNSRRSLRECTTVCAADVPPAGAPRGLAGNALCHATPGPPPPTPGPKPGVPGAKVCPRRPRPPPLLGITSSTRRRQPERLLSAGEAVAYGTDSAFSLKVRGCTSIRPT